MSLTKFDKNINYNQEQSDQPNKTAQEMKKLLDQAGLDIKKYINEVLTEELDNLLSQKTNNTNANIENLEVQNGIKVTNTETFSAIEKDRILDGINYKTSLGIGAYSNKGVSALEIWEDGTLKGRLEVLPDGTIRNQVKNKLLLDETYKRAVMVMSPMGSQILKTTNPEKIIRDNWCEGFNCDGYLEMGEDCIVCKKSGYVMVSGQIGFSILGSKDVLHAAYIYRNDKSVARAVITPGGNYTTIAIPPTIIQVTAGSKISLYARNQTTAGSETWASENEKITRLVVEYISTL